MKIRLSKKGDSVTIRFSAKARGNEGVDLKDALLATGMTAGGDAIEKLVEMLADRGYRSELTKETKNTKEFTLSKTENK